MGTRPLPQQIKGGAIVIRHRQQHAVALAFGVADVVVGRIADAAVAAHKAAFVTAPAIGRRLSTEKYHHETQHPLTPEPHHSHHSFLLVSIMQRAAVDFFQRQRYRRAATLRT